LDTATTVVEASVDAITVVPDLRCSDNLVLSVQASLIGSDNSRVQATLSTTYKYVKYSYCCSITLPSNSLNCTLPQGFWHTHTTTYTDPSDFFNTNNICGYPFMNIFDIPITTMSKQGSLWLRFTQAYMTAAFNTELGADATSITSVMTDSARLITTYCNTFIGADTAQSTTQDILNTISDYTGILSAYNLGLGAVQSCMLQDSGLASCGCSCLDPDSEVIITLASGVEQSFNIRLPFTETPKRGTDSRVMVTSQMTVISGKFYSAKIQSTENGPYINYNSQGVATFEPPKTSDPVRLVAKGDGKVSFQFILTHTNTAALTTASAFAIFVVLAVWLFL